MAAPLKLEVVMSMVDKALAPLRGIDRQAKATAQGLKATRDTLKALERSQDDVAEFRKLRQGMRSGADAAKAAQDKVRALAQQMQAAETPTRAMERAFTKARREATALGDEQQAMAAKAQQLRDRLAAAGISTSQLGQHERDLRGRIASTTDAITRQTTALNTLRAQHRKMAELKEAHGRRMAGAATMAGAGVAGVMTGRVLAQPVQASLGAYGEQENASTQLRASMMQADGSVPEDFERITELATRLGDRLPGTTAEFQEMMTMLRRQGLSAQSILGGTGEAAALLGVQLRMPVTEAAEFAAKMQDATRTTEGDMLGLMDMIQRTFYLGVDSGNMLQGFSNLSPVLGIIKKQGLEGSKALAPMLVMMDQTGMAGESAGNAIRKVFQAGLDMKKLGKANALLKQAKAGFSIDFTDGKGNFGGVEKLFAEIQKLNGIQSDTVREAVKKQIFGDDAETLRVVDAFRDKGMAGYNEVVAKMQEQADLRKRVDMQLGTLSNVVEAAQGTWTNVLAAIGETVAPEAKNLVNWLGETASAVGGWVKANPQLVAWLAKIAAVVAVLYVAIGGLMLGLAGVLGPMLVVRFALQAIGVQGGLLALVLRGAAGAVRFLGGALVGVLRLLLAHPIVAIVAGIALAAFMVYRHWGAISGFFAGLWQTVKATAAAAWQGIAGALAAVWQGVQSTAASVWRQLGGSFPAVLMTITAAIVNWSPLGLFYQAFAGVLGFFGIQLPQRFTEFGTFIVQGLARGITNALGMLRAAVTGAAESAIGWFKEKLGIHSPSRVFMAAGVNVGEGAAQGIGGTQRMVRRAAGAMAAAAAVVLPAPAIAAPPPLPEQVQQVTTAMPPALSPLVQRVEAATPPQLPELVQRVALAMPQAMSPALQAPEAGAPELAAVQTVAPIDRRPPLTAAPALRPAPAPAAPAAGDRIEIHIHAAPGMDARAVAAAVRAELERRDAEKRSRAGGGFYDFTN